MTGDGLVERRNKVAKRRAVHCAGLVLGVLVQQVTRLRLGFGIVPQSRSLRLPMLSTGDG